MMKPVLIMGCGSSGIDAANLLLREERPIFMYDKNTGLDTEAVSKKISGPVRYLLGSLEGADLQTLDFCVVSPGVPLDSPEVVLLNENGIPVISEIELAYRYEKGTVIGITGTNGKTTTTTLVGEMMKKMRGDGLAFTVGNIGTPYAKEVLKTSPGSVSTIELSSFQLESVDSFHPHVSAILNITPDHLNRHHTMDNYAAAKERVTENQDENDFCVLNAEDPYLEKFRSAGLRPKVILFSSKRALRDGYYLSGDTIYRSEHGNAEPLLKTSETTLVGVCNYENIMAAMGMAEAMGMDREEMLSVIRDFRAVSHRIEYVRELRGVRYYDDSKGTNVDAAVQGIRAMTGKTILIGGGYDKGVEFDDWIREFGSKVKLLLLMGVTKEKIAACAEKYGFRDYRFVSSMEEAVRIAHETAEPGEFVLLSPACASWDMFDSYEQRGDIFKELVRKLS